MFVTSNLKQDSQEREFGGVKPLNLTKTSFQPWMQLTLSPQANNNRNPFPKNLVQKCW